MFFVAQIKLTFTFDYNLKHSLHDLNTPIHAALPGVFYDEYMRT
jgi:hypothetical protein